MNCYSNDDAAENVSVSKKSLFLAFLMVALIAALSSYLLATRPQPQAALEPVKPVAVSVSRVERRNLRPTRIVTGRLRPARALGLQFEVGGRVQARHVEPGQKVAAGSVMLELAAEDYRDMVIDAQAQLEQERAAVARDRRLLDIAKRNAELQAGEVKRLEHLSSTSLAAQSALDEARKLQLQLVAEEERLHFSVDTAVSRIALRESALRRAQRDLERSQLRAPFDAVINHVAVEVGDFVTTSQVVVEVLEAGIFDLAIETDGATAAVLSLGQTVAVTIDGQPQDGEIVALQSDPDSETFTHAVRIRVAANGLLPGVLASAELPLAPLSGVLTVPVTAILREEGRAYVFRLQDDRLQRLPVTTGIRYNDEQVIAGDIGAGERVVSRGVAALSDGQQVSLP